MWCRGITDDAALGQFYVENDFLPELEKCRTAYWKCWTTRRSADRCARARRRIHPHGYVMQEAELRQAPPNLGRPPRKPPYMIYFLCVSDARAVKLYLPAKQAELDAVLDCLEVDCWQEVRLEEKNPRRGGCSEEAGEGKSTLSVPGGGKRRKVKAVAGQLDIKAWTMRLHWQSI